MLVKTQTIDQVVIKSGYAYEKVKAENGDVLDKVIYMPIVDLNKPDAELFIEGYRQMRPVAMECCFSEVTPEVLRLLQKVKDNGSKIWLNGLWPSLNGGHDDDRAVELNQKDESWGWLLEKGASLIQTDRPVQLLQYLKRRADDEKDRYMLFGLTVFSMLVCTSPEGIPFNLHGEGRE